MKSFFVVLFLSFTAIANANVECKEHQNPNYRPGLICGEVINTPNGNIKISNIRFGKDWLASTPYAQKKICELFVNASSKPINMSRKLTYNNFDLETGNRSVIDSVYKVVPYLYSVTCK